MNFQTYTNSGFAGDLLRHRGISVFIEFRLWMLTFCPKCIIISDIKGFETIPKIFERPKIITDYLFQAESD
jgi:hypothetical protein